MRMPAKAVGRGNNIVIQHAKRTKSHALRLVPVCKTETVPSLQPALFNMMARLRGNMCESHGQEEVVRLYCSVRPLCFPAMQEKKKISTKPLRHFLFVANTQSGTMHIEQLRETLKKHFDGQKATFDVLELRHGDKHMDKTISTAIEKYAPDCVVACGGDGTVATVGHALKNLDTPLGIIPLGTANIFAKSMDIPVQTDKALEVLLAPHPGLRTLDAMECMGKLYFLQITIGISSLITYRTPQDLKRRFGNFAYITRLFRYLNRFHRTKFVFHIDGKRYERKVTEVVMANTDMFFSRPFRLGEHIAMDDGVLDLLAFSPRNWLDHFKFMSYFTFGKPTMERKIFFRHRFKTLRIETRKPKMIHADGEIIGKTPVDIVLKPAILQVVVSE